MKNIEIYGLQPLSHEEQKQVNGGITFVKAYLAYTGVVTATVGLFQLGRMMGHKLHSLIHS